MERLIGREKEKQELREYLNSGMAEFIAIYGRRRVGKTYLITQLFGNRLAFDMAGVIGGTQEEELMLFDAALRKCGFEGRKSANWYEAFSSLAQIMDEKDDGRQQILFIDELPCLDTHGSEFVKAIDHFWNTWASRNPRIKLIVCGSATSWMITNLIDNHGGLHNRITHEMHLLQFTLKETEEYLQMRDIHWDRSMIVQAYMIFGGVPYYLSLLKKDESLAQNIDRLYFSENGILKGEFRRLYASLFKNAEGYMRIIQLLSENKKGLTRREIAQKLEISSGGSLSNRLEELTNCDFIRCYHLRKKTKISKNGIYQLTDFFSIFHLWFSRKTITEPHYWQKNINTPLINNWQGLAFERVCMAHIEQIKKALGISAIQTEYYSWRSNTEDLPEDMKENKAQIDLMIDRADRMMNLCEIKYCEGKYLLRKEELEKIFMLRSLFKAETGTRSGIFLTMITPEGLIGNKYSIQINQQVDYNQLFETA